MNYVAIAVFVVAYALIASDRFNKTLVALTGAAVVVALPVIHSDDVFYSHNTGIDWDVIFLLLGMMIIVSVLRQTGVFEYTAIWAAKRANGKPLRIMILLVLVTAVASALLDNVTTVLLVAPVTLLVCDRLAIGPAPFLMAEAFASNIGGTATLIGDPPSIIIGSRAGLSFNDFLANLTPIVLIIIAVFVDVVTAPLSRRVRRRSRAGRRRLVAGRTRSHPRPPAAHQVRRCPGGGLHRCSSRTRRYTWNRPSWRCWAPASSS